MEPLVEIAGPSSGCKWLRAPATSCIGIILIGLIGLLLELALSLVQQRCSWQGRETHPRSGDGRETKLRPQRGAERAQPLGAERLVG